MAVVIDFPCKPFSCVTWFAALPTSERWGRIKGTLTKRDRPRKKVHFTLFDCEECMYVRSG